MKPEVAPAGHRSLIQIRALVELKCSFPRSFDVADAQHAVPGVLVTVNCRQLQTKELP